MPNVEPLICYFDGGDKAPDKFEYCFFVQDKEGKNQPEIVKNLSLQSHNEAEYCALIDLMKYLRKHEVAQPVLVIGDSQLIIYQMQGKYAVKDPRLKPLYEQAKELSSQLTISYKWMPREHNFAGIALEKGIHYIKRESQMDKLVVRVEKASKELLINPDIMPLNRWYEFEFNGRLMQIIKHPTGELKLREV